MPTLHFNILLYSHQKGINDEDVRCVPTTCKQEKMLLASCFRKRRLRHGWIKDRSVCLSVCLSVCQSIERKKFSYSSDRDPKDGAYVRVRPLTLSLAVSVLTETFSLKKTLKIKTVLGTAAPVLPET